MHKVIESEATADLDPDKQQNFKRQTFFPSFTIKIERQK
jgi:hypothetical protein